VADGERDERPQHWWSAMTRFLLALLVLPLMLGRATPAAELIMFERDGCPYCAAFDREVAPIYPKAAEGARAPLRRVDIMRPVPRDLAFVKVERITPVFVLVDKGREVGRIRGYPGEDFFWGQLGVLIRRLSTAALP
jgi:hypothetical protein